MCKYAYTAYVNVQLGTHDTYKTHTYMHTQYMQYYTDIYFLLLTTTQQLSAVLPERLSPPQALSASDSSWYQQEPEESTGPRLVTGQTLLKSSFPVVLPYGPMCPLRGRHSDGLPTGL